MSRVSDDKGMTPSRSRKLLLAVAALCAVLAMTLTACGGNSTPSSEESESSSTVEQPKTTVTLQASDREASALSELSQLYASEHDDVTFEVRSAKTDKEMRKQLAASYDAAKAASDSESSASSSSESAGGSTGSDDGDASNPVAAVVGMSSDDQAKAADDKEVSASTATDLVQDSLVIATAQTKDVSMRDLLSGDYRLYVVDNDTSDAMLQHQALVRLGACTVSGRYVGALAGKGKVKSFRSTAKLFAALSKNKKAAAVVLRSDVYRYGGVKISGEIPADAYDAPVYSYAMTTFASDEQTEKAQEFFNWSVSDADALRIWKKWGFAAAA